VCQSISALRSAFYKIPAKIHQPRQYQTLAEVWNGSKWTVVPSLDPGSDDYLYGVACSSVDFCVAVGSTQAAEQSVSQSLVELWNGTSWSVTSSPDPGTGSPTLYGVSCTSPSSCTAVGWNGEPLAETWDGSQWTIATTPNIGRAVFYAVSCTARDACTAVGNSNSSGDRTLVESWNGSAWSVIASPNKVGLNDNLAAVSCAATSGCIAVGTYDKSSYIFRTLVEASN
jgi:hypothetical protein